MTGAETAVRDREVPMTTAVNEAMSADPDPVSSPTTPHPGPLLGRGGEGREREPAMRRRMRARVAQLLAIAAPTVGEIEERLFLQDYLARNFER